MQGIPKGIPFFKSHFIERMVRGILLTLLAVILTLVETSAAEYYCDPQNGNVNNDGSQSSPWSSLADIVWVKKTLNDGDIIYLLDGNHGRPYIADYRMSGVGITVKPLDGHSPIIGSLQFANCSNWTFENVTVEGSTTTLNKDGFMVISDVNTDHLTFDNCEVRSAENSSTWTKDDWYANAIGGFDMRGEYITVENTTIKNTYHALSLRGNHARAANNLIDNFAGDAIRGHGDHSVYEYNVVRDCYIDDYAIQHDDAFQAYRLSGEELKIEGVIIRNNKFLLFEDEITQFVTANDLIGNLMQGIIITDGYADGWIIENNLVINDQSHGISLVGARNCRIQNNTVIQHPEYTDSEVPWIYIDDNKKTGQTNFNNIVRNNLTGKLTTWTFDDSSTVENNIDIDEGNQSEYEAHFVDYANLDFHLESTSSAVDAGINSDLADKDLDGAARVFNTTVDIGAYEYGAASDNISPVLASISDQSTGEGLVVQISVTASDSDDDILMLTASNMPSFGSFTDHGGGTGTISFSPLTGDAGTYTNISIAVNDGTETITETFDLTVSSPSDTPVLNAISNQSLLVGDVVNVALTSIYSGSGTLSFSGFNMPSFVTLTDNGDGTGNLQLAPLPGTAGQYSSIQITLSDGAFSVTESFEITVENGVLGLEEAGNKTISVYPNPSTSGEFFLQLPRELMQAYFDISIFSSTGQLMYEVSKEQLKMMDSNTIKLSQRLNAGLYIVKFFGSNHSLHTRLIIQ